ncbi:hypothetical protein SAMN06297280_1230 [Arsukibacterium tuosuense]|uniref:Uncharacterized protein n=1 Tax=Arsukibacterium tuosuense TaxID=1323745 RepID=A0A285IQ00_9GAMM|nr:hypothetical protein SAMN06297280_1230 [Arsukibacterium tuosuense]
MYKFIDFLYLKSRNVQESHFSEQVRILYMRLAGILVSST